MLPIVSKTPVSKIKSSTFLEPKREVINGINSLFLKSFSEYETPLIASHLL